jgi:ABC-type polysaccharide/polyol phosphate export permease
VMYPIAILPGWAEQIAILNPFVQILQDVRDIVFDVPNSSVTELLGGSARRLIPIAIAIWTLVVGLWLYRREAPRFAERA